MASNGLSCQLVFAIAAATLGSGFQHGYNTGVINTPEKIIKEWITSAKQNRSSGSLEVGPLEESVTITWAITVAIFCIGGMFGGAIVGVVSDIFGRKGSLLLNNLFVFLGAALMYFAKPLDDYEMLISGRFVVGINAGLNAGLTPMYLNEISPVHLRGAVGTVYQLIITISILVSQVLSYKGFMGTPELWPLLLALIIIPAIFQLVTLSCCPESPKYLLATKSNDEEALKALKWFRGTDDVSSEMNVMRAERDALKQAPQVTFYQILANPSLRAPLMISAMIMLAQQFSGINAIMFYSTQIFGMASLDEIEAQTATIGVGVVNVLMTIVSMAIVEKAGRKTLLLIGFFGMFIDTVLLAFTMTSLTCSAAPIMAVALVFIYIILFASGAGSIPWFLVSELFNQSARPIATSIAVTVNWSANFIVGMTFPTLAKLIGSNIFYGFAGLQLLFTIYIWMKVPETKNKSIEEIASLFRTPA